MQEENVIVGCLEQVAFPGLFVDEVMAKIDTGAYSGALHCEDLEVIERNGKKILRFRPIHNKSDLVEFESFKTVQVTSSNGHKSQRYIIETDILMHGKEYEISISLTDRADLKMDVLIGRRFLRKNNMLVDVRIGAEFDEDGGGKE